MGGDQWTGPRAVLWGTPPFEGCVGAEGLMRGLGEWRRIETDEVWKNRASGRSAES